MGVTRFTSHLLGWSSKKPSGLSLNHALFQEKRAQIRCESVYYAIRGHFEQNIILIFSENLNHRNYQSYHKRPLRIVSGGQVQCCDKGKGGTAFCLPCLPRWQARDRKYPRKRRAKEPKIFTQTFMSGANLKPNPPCLPPHPRRLKP